MGLATSGSARTLVTSVSVAVLLAAIALPQPAMGEECVPGEDGCVPTQEQCATGQHDGVWLGDPAFPAAVCHSGSDTYLGGDPTIPCGTIRVGGTTVVDTVRGDANACGVTVDATRSWGYIEMSDGARLRYTAVVPEVDGPVPVALQISPYEHGQAPMELPLANALLAAGYAVIGVNMRGTGCSSGVFTDFRPTSDHYEVVEWAAAQAWSSGDVGMFGLSALGITQLAAAATQPPSLRAIVPNEPLIDMYREHVYPGGILNWGYGIAWPVVIRPAEAAEPMPNALAEGDTACAEHQADHPPDADLAMASDRLSRPYEDGWYDERSMHRHLADIDVPVLGCIAWQDDQISPQVEWFDQLDPERTWAIFTNGYHGACDFNPDLINLSVDFFEAFVRGDPNVDFSGVPPLQLLHEVSNWNSPQPAWVGEHPWPPETTTLELLFGDGALGNEIAEAGSTAWAHPTAAQSMEATTLVEQHALWTAPPVPGTFVAFTTPALAQDIEIFGPGSVDLWLSSTAADTDLQVTLVEVRPDGQEMYLQRGWLRASHRALDESRSTATRPIHTHREEDVADLPAEPTLLRVPLTAIGHVFRAGSSIRILVDAPTGRTGFRQFAFDPTPAVNTIHFGPDHPSRLVLSMIPTGQAPEDVPFPVCGVPLHTPCRTNPFSSVPEGSLVVAAGQEAAPASPDDAGVLAGEGTPATGASLPILPLLFALGLAGILHGRGSHARHRPRGTVTGGAQRPG